MIQREVDKKIKEVKGNTVTSFRENTPCCVGEKWPNTVSTPTTEENTTVTGGRRGHFTENQTHTHAEVSSLLNNKESRVRVCSPLSSVTYTQDQRSNNSSGGSPKDERS